MFSPSHPHCGSDEETELEKKATEWGKKHRPKKKPGSFGSKTVGVTDFKGKQNVRKNKGRKR